jgi:hypothetical protein
LKAANARDQKLEDEYAALMAEVKGTSSISIAIFNVDPMIAPPQFVHLDANETLYAGGPTIAAAKHAALTGGSFSALGGPVKLPAPALPPPPSRPAPPNQPAPPPKPAPPSS